MNVIDITKMQNVVIYFSLLLCDKYLKKKQKKLKK